MKYLYKKFNLYLPRLNYNLDPMLYITNSYTIRNVYNFDRKKKVVLTSDYNKKDYRYMSLFEILYDNWVIIHKDDLDTILYPYSDESKLPF